MLPPDVPQVQDLRRINVAGFMTEWGGLHHFADAAADKQFCRCCCGQTILPMLLRTMTRADIEAGALKSAAKGSPEYLEASTVTGLADK